jgi:hypothetical protein
MDSAGAALSRSIECVRFTVFNCVAAVSDRYSAAPLKIRGPERPALRKYAGLKGPRYENTRVKDPRYENTRA